MPFRPCGSNRAGITGNKYTIIRCFHFFFCWVTLGALISYYDGQCVRWKKGKNQNEYCAESINDTLAVGVWMDENGYKELRGQFYVVAVAPLCAIISFVLIMMSLRPKTQQTTENVQMQYQQAPTTESTAAQRWAMSDEPKQPKWVKIILHICAVLMFAAGVLEIYYAAGFGRVGPILQWFGSAAAALVATAFYIVDIWFGRQAER